MIKFFKKISLFFALVALIDVACGYGFDFLKKNAKGGDTQKNYYIAEECADDILILGSSRAARHYNPIILEDSLGLSCYNCGEPGCGIITAYARYGMIETRHKPKLVVYEVSPNYDYFLTDDYSKYLGRVRQYADKHEVKNLYLQHGDELEGIRLLSNMYKNNSFLVHNVIDNVIKEKDNKGFTPLHGVMKQSAQSAISNSEEKIDNIKFSYIERLIIKLQKDSIPLCFYISPRCINKNTASIQESQYELVKQLCHNYNVPFINHTYFEGISDNQSLFQDSGHMNEKGATFYSRVICKELQRLINE